MVNARAYALVALCSHVICLWSYWRVALHLRPPGQGRAGWPSAWAVLDCSGRITLALCCCPRWVLFHLLFVPKNHRWWRPVVLFGLAGLTAIVQLSILLRGVSVNTVISEDLVDRILPATRDNLSHLLRYMTNGLLLTRPRPFSDLLLLTAATRACDHHHSTPLARKGSQCLPGCSSSHLLRCLRW